MAGPVMCSKAGEVDASSDRSCGSANFATMYDMTMEKMAFGSYGEIPIHRGYKRAYLSLKNQVTTSVHALLNKRKCSDIDANWYVCAFMCTLCPFDPHTTAAAPTPPHPSPARVRPQIFSVVFDLSVYSARSSSQVIPWAVHWPLWLFSTSL